MEKEKEKKEETAQVQPAEKEVTPLIEIDENGPYLHITVPGYDGWIQLYMNDARYKVYKVVDGLLSIQLAGPLPREYRFRAEVLNRK